MDRETVIQVLSSKLKLVRTEFGYSQERMSLVLGLSKKTLLEIEKERNRLSWTAAVALVAVFSHSEVIRNALGDDPVEVIRTVAFQHLDTPLEKTLGGRVWWREVAGTARFRVQQNLVSGHFRILDAEDRRWHSSFNREYIMDKFRQLTGEEK